MVTLCNKPNLNCDVSLDYDSIDLSPESQLFYPSSGLDIRVPTELFGPYCSDLHFADVAYFGSNFAGRLETHLPLGNAYKLRDLSEQLIDLPPYEWMSDPKYGGRQPKVRTYRYEDLRTEKELRAHLHSRRAPTVMRQGLENISIFFYRGDSEDCFTHGSGTHWLTIRKWDKRRRPRYLVFEMLNRLVDGGLLVTDGSMCLGESNPYRHLAQYRVRKQFTAREIHENTEPFEDGLGRRFQCIGAICQYSKYYPTLVWKVNRI